MASFLNQVANYLLKNHQGNFSEIQVIVPTRRAVFFLKREIGTLLEHPIVSPEIKAIDDFVEEAAGYVTTDPVNLIFYLYDAFREIDEKVDFNRFMGWGSVLLSDFDRIDKALVKANYLFDYLTEAKALERWGLAENLNSAKGNTEQFFSLFENIRKVYERFRTKLQQKNVAYPGMAYRYLSEHDTWTERFADKVFYFVGFNAFTNSEMQIVNKLRALSDRSRVFWDSDAYYMEANTVVEAGRQMRRLKAHRTFGTEWEWMGNHLLEDPKEINVYGVPNATLQTRVAGQLYQQILEKVDQPGMTAIVLADENLLTPLLYALDESVPEVNVTMGLPLRNSLLFTLVDAIFELQEHLDSVRGKGKRYNFRYVVKLLSHPFLRQYGEIKSSSFGKDFVEELIVRTHQENRVYFTEEELREESGGDPLIQKLFQPWTKGDSIAIIDSLYDIIDLLSDVYKDSKNSVELEYLYLFYTLLGKFKQSLVNGQKDLSLATLRQLFFEMIKQNRIPFSGEPVSDLQIIGLLETRALDFDRIIVLSMNEGVLPARKSQNSLIPLDIAREVGLPTYEHQEALSAYYFYRLLQRSKEIHLLYVNTTDALGGGEKSRFLYQLEYEWPRYNDNVRIVHHTVEWEGTDSSSAPIQLTKDDNVINSLLEYLNRGIYPTHIHSLLNSPFDFYVRHVLNLQEERETEEILGMDKLGSWLHQVFEELDRRYFLKGIEPTNAQIETLLDGSFRNLGGYEIDTGLNSIYFKVGAQQFMTFMKEQHLREGHRWPVATEQNLSAILEIPVQGRTVKVRLGGKIDRVEMGEDGTLYVMDYKTGSIDIKSASAISKDVEKYLTTDKDYKMNYVRQLWLYQYLVYRQMEQEGGWRLGNRVFTLGSHRVKSGFYSLKSPGRVVENPLILTDSEDPREYMRETERLLGLIVSKMFTERAYFVRN